MIPDIKNIVHRCPVCGSPRKKNRDLCFYCLRVRRNQRFTEAKLRRKSARSLRKNQSALKESKSLPAKNRKKSKIIDALMAGLPIPKPETKKPKTIRYQSLEEALIKKRLLVK